MRTQMRERERYIQHIFTRNISVLYLLYTWFLEKVKTTKDRELAKCKEPTNDIYLL